MSKFPHYQSDCRLCRRNNRLEGCTKDFAAALMARDVKTLCRILGNFVPQCPHRYTKQLRRSCSVPMGMRERFQNQVALDVSQGRADQPSSETAA